MESVRTRQKGRRLQLERRQWPFKRSQHHQHFEGKNYKKNHIWKYFVKSIFTSAWFHGNSWDKNAANNWELLCCSKYTWNHFWLILMVKNWFHVKWVQQKNSFFYTVVKWKYFSSIQFQVKPVILILTGCQHYGKGSTRPNNRRLW